MTIAESRISRADGTRQGQRRRSAGWQSVPLVLASLPVLLFLLVPLLALLLRVPIEQLVPNLQDRTVVQAVGLSLATTAVTVLSKVALGEADAGIVYTSDMVEDATGKVGRIDIPDVLNTIASYPIAPIKDSKNAELSRKFVDYVLTAEAQKILEDFGFIPVAEDQ